MLPGKLSYNILQIFDHNTVSLKLKDAEINITEEDVFNVYGMPHGGLSIILGTEEDYKERINAWHAQFIQINSLLRLLFKPCDFNQYQTILN